MTKKAIVWVREDFRIEDNEALAIATQNHEFVNTLYIYNPKNFDKKREAQKWWLSKSLENFNLDLKIDLNNSNLTPGYFIKFNYICNENKINLDDDFLKNLTTILNLYKKNKDIMYIDMILFLTDYYFNEIKYRKRVV